jgi:ribonuclease-3
MLEELENILEYKFKNKKLLKQALTHSSVTSHTGSNYERLEFLGDRVLGVAIADSLYNTFPQEAEGSLSPRHTSLVCKDTVAKVAKNLQIEKYINIATEDIRENENILCDVCEAIIGAIYMDSNSQTAINFVQRNWNNFLHLDMTPPKDAKTRLQELAHSKGYSSPVYKEVSKTGSEHNPIFTMCVKIGNIEPQNGTGHNKKLAEQNAAAKMITILEQL